MPHNEIRPVKTQKGNTRYLTTNESLIEIYRNKRELHSFTMGIPKDPDKLNFYIDSKQYKLMPID